jgi:PadR family transcriptional regulator, regulatory protein PadR
MGDAPRLTIQTYRVLAALLDQPIGEHYGLELAHLAGLPTGSIYPILARLEKAEWLQSDWERIDPATEGRRPRRYYRLTPLGERQARIACAETQRWLSPAGSFQPRVIG